MITAQFCVTGNTQQAEIVRAFGVTSISVKRAVKCYREHGAAGFYAPRKTRGPAVLKAEVLEEVQRQLDAGQDTAQIARDLQLKKNTLNKAIAAGRLRKPSRAPASSPPASLADAAKLSLVAAAASVPEAPACLPTPTSAPPARPADPPSSQSQRSTADSQAEMGMGATNQLDRVAASLGLSGPAPIRFEAALDVPHGGLLLAVPALLACGLLRHTDQHFELPPGEWGKLLGLDRVPEVGTLREKLAYLADQKQAPAWNAALSRDWMQELPAGTAAFCVDGHVRVYHGDQTLLPRHIQASELPKEDRFQRLRTDDGRQLIASLFQTPADLHPDDASGTLTVRLHHSANHAHDEVIRHLCAELNATATDFPGTNLRLVYELGAT